MFSSDTESRVFNWADAESTKSKDAGLRLSPEWQWRARLTERGRGGGGDRGCDGGGAVAGMATMASYAT